MYRAKWCISATPDLSLTPDRCRTLEAHLPALLLVLFVLVFRRIIIELKLLTDLTRMKILEIRGIFALVGFGTVGRGPLPFKLLLTLLLLGKLSSSLVAFISPCN